ncbi:amidohydrolase [Calocera viscosa TUFC12733]|uniref:Amidohydrolase n=1 Tax=Calocera viscosa (strain TUFC12733) TaxID=1330018 RepID=A0A167SFL8_CALVF|nr:amidohydrolase [Calocera viscosa TUFC12733]
MPGVPGCFPFLKRKSAPAAPAPAPALSPAAQVEGCESHSHSHSHSSPSSGPFPCDGLCDFLIPPVPAEAWDAPPKYDFERFGGYAFDEEASRTVEAAIEAVAGELRDLSLKIHDHPELMFKEYYAHDQLTAYMESHGFAVTRRYKGLETAWLATVTVGKGGRTLGFNSEMDALPGIGHACGHNLIAIGGVAAAIGVAAALKKHSLPGTVSLIGTPAEEGGAGKAILLERGAYDDFAACLMIHPTRGEKLTTGLASTLAIERLDAEFAGHTAHASAAPWEGRNALDAAFVSYAAVSALRQQVKPTHRIHGVVEGRDWAANIIPDYAKMSYFIRAPSYKEVMDLEPRMRACFEAAAHATNTKLTFGTSTFMYDLFQNSALGAEYTRIVESRYGMRVGVGSVGEVRASTDFGNITYALPGLHPGYAIPTVENGGNHTRQFTAAAATLEAHEATLLAAKGIALAGMRVLLDKEFAQRVMQDFKAGKPQ